MARLVLHGHHRSGNHWLAALISTNFYGKDDYRFLLNSRQHGLTSCIAPCVRYIYIERNFMDVAKSVFAMRARFGLDVDSFEVFLETPYRQMYTGQLAVDLETNFICEQGGSRSSSLFFRGIDETPEGWHKRHLEHHHRVFEGKDNCLIVSYDALKQDLNAEMTRIAEFTAT